MESRDPQGEGGGVRRPHSKTTSPGPPRTRPPPRSLPPPPPSSPLCSDPGPGDPVPSPVKPGRVLAGPGEWGGGRWGENPALAQPARNGLWGGGGRGRGRQRCAHLQRGGCRYGRARPRSVPGALPPPPVPRCPRGGCPRGATLAASAGRSGGGDVSSVVPLESRRIGGPWVRSPGWRGCPHQQPLCPPANNWMPTRDGFH